jgi:aspartate beta-hydroxylase
MRISQLSFAKIQAALSPIAAFMRVIPLLFEVHRDAELQKIARSYLGWIPLCIFSEPRLWLWLILTSRWRFRTGYQKPYSFYAPHLEARPFAECNQTSAWLEAQFPLINREFAKLCAAEVESPSKALVKTGTWNTFPLLRAAKKVPENIARCPETWATAESCPIPSGVRGGVYFSIVYPHTHIRSHCGPSNLKLRYHLTIEEAEGAKIRSGAEWRTWRRGQCLILDDSFEHEVIHDGETRRVVLIVDCWHPDLTEKDRAFLARLHKAWRGG